MKFKDLIDPDRDWRSWATIEHYLICFVLCALFDLPLTTWAAFLLTVWTAGVWEAAQTDSTYSIKDSTGRRYAGRAGYGFGLMDLAAGTAGALTWILLHWLLNRVFAL